MSVENGALGRQDSNVKFEHNRDCIWCINGRCFDMLSRLFNTECDGTRKCKLPWRDGGWLYHQWKTGEA